MCRGLHIWGDSYAGVSCKAVLLYRALSVYMGVPAYRNPYIWILVYRRQLTRLVERAGVLGAASRDAQSLEGAVLQAAGIQGSPLPNNKY